MATPGRVVLFKEATMDLDVTTFLTTVSCIVDDLYQAHVAPPKPRRPGPPPQMSDSEVLTLTLLAHWHPDRSERAFLQYVHRHWRRSFPRRLTQSAFNHRARPVRRAQPAGAAGGPRPPADPAHAAGLRGAGQRAGAAAASLPRGPPSPGRRRGRLRPGRPC